MPEVLVNNAALNPKMKKFTKNKSTGTIENYDIEYLKGDRCKSYFCIYND